MLCELDERKSAMNDIVIDMPEVAKVLLCWVFITTINNDNYQ